MCLHLFVNLGVTIGCGGNLVFPEQARVGDPLELLQGAQEVVTVPSAQAEHRIQATGVVDPCERIPRPVKFQDANVERMLEVLHDARHLFEPAEVAKEECAHGRVAVGQVEQGGEVGFQRSPKASQTRQPRASLCRAVHGHDKRNAPWLTLKEMATRHGPNALGRLSRASTSEKRRNVSIGAQAQGEAGEGGEPKLERKDEKQTQR
jgi:hypothetical protein